MKRHKMIGSELCAGEVTICRKRKINFSSTTIPEHDKPYLWCPECRAVLYNTRGKKPKENKYEVASSISEDADDNTSNSDIGDVDNASEIGAADNPNSITCKLNTIVSRLEELPQQTENVESVEISNRFDKLGKMLQTQYAMLTRLL